MALSGPKMTQKGLKWPEHIKIANWNYLHSISASLAVILSCHMTSLRQFWVWGQKWPKKTPNDQKLPEYLKNDIQNHLHWISASLAVILSGHMTSLRQFWIWGQNGQNGQKWPKMAPNDQKWPECLKSDWNWLIWYCHSSYRPILSTSANFIQQWGWTSQKSQFWHPEKFFMECHYRSYFIIFIHPKCKISEN